MIFLIKLFKENQGNHIGSLNIQEKKTQGIFIIEYSDSALEMLENVYEKWKDGMPQGDLRELE